MWKSVLIGIIQENIETLKHYQSLKDKKNSTFEEIFQFVSKVLNNQPWYFRFPIRVLVSAIGIYCLIATRNELNLLSSERRASFLRRIKFFPFFGMLNKLVRSIAFLRLFDILPLSSAYLSSDNIERY
jgi:hypothetical protein